MTNDVKCKQFPRLTRLFTSCLYYNSVKVSQLVEFSKFCIAKKNKTILRL